MSTQLVLVLKKLLLSVIISAQWLEFTRAIIFDEVSSLHIWITVSSLAIKERQHSAASGARPLIARQIELNWINAPLDHHNDFLALFLDTPPGELDSSSLPVHVHPLQGRMSGKISTQFYLPLINFMNETRHLQRENSQTHDNNPEVQIDKWHQYGDQVQVNQYQRTSQTKASSTWSSSLLSDECLGYCLAYFSEGRILARSCLKTQPTWMHDTRTSARSLPALMLPGTHNSATYARQLDKSVLHHINKYQINQDESVFNQLIYGIRYLDLRVGHTAAAHVRGGRREQFWIYHDIFRTDVTLDEVLEQVRRFLELTSHEIIVMDFHRFTVGFQNENLQTQRARHAQLLELLFNQLGDYIIPSYLGQHAPLNEYIGMGKRLLVGYANRGQLLGPLAASQSNLFGLYTNDNNNKKHKQKQKLEVDKKGDEVMSSDNQDDDNNQMDDSMRVQPADQRMGTRIFNRLKSVKLIARTFSKRSIINDDDAINETSSRNVPFGNKYTLPGAKKPSAQLVVSQHRGDLINNDDQDNEIDALNALPSRLALLFPPVRHLWPNKDTIEGLAQYMNDTTCRKYFGELRSMMVELTPTVFGAISDKYDGNRRLADQVNRPVTDWIRSRWLHCINIVASDFFQGNDLIQLAIYANRIRAPQHETKNSLDLSSLGATCKSFRPIEHLLDSSKISIVAATAGVANPVARSYDQTNVQPVEGISDLMSFFKRLFNL